MDTLPLALTGVSSLDLAAGPHRNGGLFSGPAVAALRTRGVMLVLFRSDSSRRGNRKPGNLTYFGSTGVHVSGSVANIRLQTLSIFELMSIGSNGNFGLYDATNAAYRLYVISSTGNDGAWLSPGWSRGDRLHAGQINHRHKQSLYRPQQYRWRCNSWN